MVTLNSSPLPDFTSELHMRLGQQQKRATPSFKETSAGSVQLNFLTSKLSQLFSHFCEISSRIPKPPCTFNHNYSDDG